MPKQERHLNMNEIVRSTVLTGAASFPFQRQLGCFCWRQLYPLGTEQKRKLPAPKTLKGQQFGKS